MQVNKLIENAPYYDDVATAERNNYYKALFIPARAVQARELSQIQSIQYAQQKRLGDHLFKNGSIVIPGDISFDTKFISLTLDVTGLSSPVKVNLQSETYRTNTVIGNFVSNGTIKAQISFAESIDINTLKVYVKYTASNGSSGVFIATNTVAIKDIAETTIFGSLTVSSVGTATSAKITDGVFYINGIFAAVYSQEKIIAQTNTPTLSCGLTVEEKIITESLDSSLLDPANGFSNFNAPGAHRYQLNLLLTAGAISPATNTDYIELLVLESGIATKLVKRTSYNLLADELARRTFDESGDYTVRPFIASIEENTLDDTKLRIGVEAGKAYVKGYEIETIAKQYVNDLDKARDTDSENNKTVTALVGNYIDVISGKTAASEVDLPNVLTYESPGTGAVKIYNKAGTQIGTLFVRQITTTTGTRYPDSVTTSNFIRLSVFNVQMVSGYTFGNAWSLGATAGDWLIRQDYIELQGTITIAGTAVTGSNTRFLTSPTLNLAIGDKVFYGSGALPPGDWEYNTVSAVASDSALTLGTSEGLTNVTAIKMYYVYADIKETGKAAALYTLPNQKIKQISDANYTYTKRLTASAGGSNAVTIAPGGGDEFVSSSISDYILYNDTTDTYLPITSISGFSTSSATLNVASGISAANQIVVQAKVRDSSVAIKSKGAIQTNQTYTFAASGVNASLSKADFWIPASVHIFRLVSVVDNSIDVTANYDFDNGERDTYYDLARLTLKKDKTVQTSGSLVVTYDCLAHASGSFYSVDSYPDYDLIPTYTSKTDGTVYDLRDCLDFRPAINTTRTAFLYTSKIPVDFVSIDYEYYLNRIDKLVLDTNGDFKVIKGISALNPLPPATPANAMAIYNLMVRAYTLTPTDCIMGFIENKRYTMRDIGSLESRISNLEYYTTLSLLEKETADLEILDENGLSRFKNGFIVDPFNGHGIGDVTSPEYRCSIDMQRGECRPMFTSNIFNLAVADVSTVQQTGDLVTLPYTEIGFIEQKWATGFLNVNPYNVFTFLGRLSLVPPFDQWKDTNTLPDLIVNQEGNYDSMVAVSNAYGTVWDEWTTNWTGQTSSRERSREVISRGDNSPDAGHGNNWPLLVRTNTTKTVTKTGMATRSGTQLTVVPETVTTNLGDKVVDVSYIPFMRSIDVTFTGKGFKPGTRLYAFFDDVDVSTYCTSGVSYNPANNISTGTQLVTDATGKAVGVFRIPNSSVQKFKTGSRLFTLTDDSTNSELLRTTFGSETFEAEGLLESKQTTILSTRNAKLVASTIIENKAVSDTTITTATTTKWEDPLAQSFLIGEKGGCFVSSVDLFFATKDPNIPVIVYISTMQNGYPTQTIIPFSQVVVESADINVTPYTNVLQSADITATNVKFPSPVYLEEGTEYALVIISNSNAYNLWIATGGNNQIGTEFPMMSQPYTGSLFKSQNASTWTPQQESDLKFKMYKCIFDTDTYLTAKFRNTSIGARSIAGISYMRATASATTANTNFRVDISNHGLIVGDTITLAGVVNFNDALAASLNGTHTVTAVGLNWVVFQVASMSYAATGTLGAIVRGSTTGVTAITNLPFDDLYIQARNLNFTGTELDFEIDYRLGEHPNDSGSSGNQYTSITGVSVAANQTLTFSDGRKIVSSDANQTFHSGTRAFELRGTLHTTNPNVSPVIDVAGLSCITVENKISVYNNSTDTTFVPTIVSGSMTATVSDNTLKSATSNNYFDTIQPGMVITLSGTTGNDGTYLVRDKKQVSTDTVLYFGTLADGSGATILGTHTETTTIKLNLDFIDEISTNSGTAESKYLTRSFSLANAADSVQVKVAAYWPNSFEIAVYYKTLPVYGSGNIDDNQWVKVVPSAISYSTDINDYREFTFNINSLEDFSALQAKLCFFMVPNGSSPINTSGVPKLRDLSVIALS